jgi:tetratricopeptide (TPR) repeat protein
LKIITATRVLLSLGLVATIDVAAVSAQQNSEKKNPRQAPTSSATASKSHARRVLANSSGEPKPSTNQSSAPKTVESSSENSIKPTDAADKMSEEQAEPTKPGDKSTEKADAKSFEPTSTDTKAADSSPDNLISLRDQIEATPSGTERIRLQLKLAEELVAAGKKTEAIAELHAIVNTDVFDPQGLYNGGNALAHLGDDDAAINAYRKAIEQRKGNYSRALNNLGVVLMREGRWDEAHNALSSALMLESFRYAEASYNLGRLYSARGESDLAIREWRRALAVDPQHTAAAQALSSSGSGSAIVVRPDASDKGLGVTKNIDRSSETSAGHTVVSGRSRNNSAPRNAGAVKVLTIDPVSYQFLQRARNSSENGKLQEAVENYQRVLSRSRGYFPPANLELSYVLMRLKRNDEAFANLRQVANRDGARYPFSYYYLGRLYERKGDLKLAEESLARAAVSYKAKDNAFLLDLSRVRELRGDFKGAVTAIEQYIATMDQQGARPYWLDKKLSVLRRKATGEPK